MFELARFISITIKSTCKATLPHLVTKKGINLLPTAITVSGHFLAEVGPPPFLLHANSQGGAVGKKTNFSEEKV